MMSLIVSDELRASAAPGIVCVEQYEDGEVAGHNTDSWAMQTPPDGGKSPRGLMRHPCVRFPLVDAMVPAYW